MSETAEAAPMTTIKAQNKSVFSPLQLFQQRYCRHCSRHCSPTEQRFLTCLLAALLDTIYRANALSEKRFAHY